MTPEKLEHARRVVDAVIDEQMDDVVFGALGWRLYDEGITEFPVLYMTTKSDWDRYPEPE